MAKIALARHRRSSRSDKEQRERPTAWDVPSQGEKPVTDYIQAWQCIGCGRIEAPQTCIGVCQDRKILMIGKEEHERVVDELRTRIARVHERLLRFGFATPREGHWERTRRALQDEVSEVLALLTEAG